jgi:hypothetical protein
MYNAFPPVAIDAARGALVTVTNLLVAAVAVAARA